VSQLFKTRPVDVPYSVMLLKDGAHVSSQHIEAFPFMYWPSGRPCDPLNMYFLEVAHLTTGESLKSFASELSHLVRYCGARQVPISALSDAHIFELSKLLQEERSSRDPNVRARNNNTVRAILSRVIRFLQWYQVNLVPVTSTPLIGENSSSPQICVKRVQSPTRNSNRPGVYYVHRAMPTPESREPKHPLAQPVIEAIEQCVDTLSAIESQSARFVQRYRNRPELLNAQLGYIRSRRHFMIWLMKRAGLRPAEMVEISVREHMNILQLKRVLIPTKKRRRDHSPLRSFPITLKDATVFQRYLTSRTKYCEVLRQSGQTTEPSDALFLGVDGSPIKKTSLERDFARLVVAAGFRDVQACFSMFRHRFITYEVIVHLKEFMASAGKTPQVMTSTDYESILKRVSVKTGHGSVQSLWHYIDLAWKEIDVWGGVDTAIERLHAADRLYDDLLALKHELEGINASAATKQLAEEIASKLGVIVSSAKQDIDTSGIAEGQLPNV
jgi:hypothetical protein